jgi:hypothetical protein
MGADCADDISVKFWAVLVTDNTPTHLVSPETQGTDLHVEVLPPRQHPILNSLYVLQLIWFGVCVIALLLNMELALMQIF